VIGLLLDGLRLFRDALLRRGGRRSRRVDAALWSVRRTGW
jgi:hypothetical protein